MPDISLIPPTKLSFVKPPNMISQIIETNASLMCEGGIKCLLPPLEG